MIEIIKKCLGNVKDILLPTTEKPANIYHCCVQKTASRWIQQILFDKMVCKRYRFEAYDPGINHLEDEKEVHNLKVNPFPQNRIISPLYICYEDFEEIKKQKNYKAFFIMRDPRDLLISHYFSLKYSHPENPYVVKQRNVLTDMDEQSGISYMIKMIDQFKMRMYFSMVPWYRAGQNNKNVKVLKYEDIVGPHQKEMFNLLFKHLNIPLKEYHLHMLLEKYSFKRLSGGRNQGSEDQKSHYRKGIPGDWENYFSEEHKRIFKAATGQLLLDLGYEKDSEW